MKKNIQDLRKKVCTMANELRKKGLTLSQAFKKAWRRIKEGMTLRAAGVTFDNGQGKLAYLKKFKPEDLQAVLVRDQGNRHDASAIRILVKIPAAGKMAYIGYVPAAVSKELARILDKGLQIRAEVMGVIGGYDYKENYGLLLSLSA